MSRWERVPGIEPGPKDWKSLVLPLNYTREECVYFIIVQPVLPPFRVYSSIWSVFAYGEVFLYNTSCPSVYHEKGVIFVKFIRTNIVYIAMVIVTAVFVIGNLISLHNTIVATHQLVFNVPMKVQFISEPKMVNGVLARVMSVEWDPEGHPGKFDKFYYSAGSFEEIQTKRVSGGCIMTMIQTEDETLLQVKLPVSGRKACPTEES